MSNVVMFPKAKKDSPVQTMDDVMGNVISSRVAQIDFLADEFASFIFSRAYDEGYDINEEKCTKINMLMFESIRASLMLAQDIPHFLQDVADEMIDFDDEEADLPDA